jgi:hypothetical protein
MRKTWMAAAVLGLGLGLLGGRARAAAEAPEPVLEVDLGGQPTDTPSPVPTATPLPPTPTALPSPAPEAAAKPLSASAELDLGPSPSPTPPAEDLKQPRFDKAMPEEDGLMIIAPGAASPEDSLESFGIESPFNWKDRQSRTLQPGKDADAAKGGANGEELELSAPESSDLNERVSVENGEGEAQPSDVDYDRIERAGGVLNAGEYRVDGRVERNKDGQIFARSRVQVALRMEPGRQVYPGSVYTVFREGGLLSTTGDDSHEVGQLVVNVGVLRVTRIEGEEVLARVEKQYEAIREGDLIRLRDPERLKYYAALRQGPATPALDLQGEVVGLIPPTLVANRGDVVYLDIGRAKGVVPGMRLMLTRDAEDLGADGIRSLMPTGRFGVVQVVNTSRDACVARVVQSLGEVRLGDRVRYR